MRAKYFGKKCLRNEFGDVVKRFAPEIEISFTEKEVSKAFRRIERMGVERYDVDACGNAWCIRIPVSDREEGNDVLEAWRLSKKDHA